MKSQFRLPLLVEKLDGADWRVAVDFPYYSEEYDFEGVVEKGFVSDFASVPRIPLVYMLTGNTAHKPSLYHDWNYRNCLHTREKCDRMFREGMVITGEPVWRCNAMYAAVRMFGGQHYRGGNPASSRMGNTKALEIAAPPAVQRFLIKPAKLRSIPGLRGHPNEIHPTIMEITA